MLCITFRDCHNNTGLGSGLEQPYIQTFILVFINEPNLITNIKFPRNTWQTKKLKRQCVPVGSIGSMSFFRVGQVTGNNFLWP